MGQIEVGLGGDGGGNAVMVSDPTLGLRTGMTTLSGTVSV